MISSQLKRSREVDSPRANKGECKNKGTKCTHPLEDGVFGVHHSGRVLGRRPARGGRVGPRRRRGLGRRDPGMGGVLFIIIGLRRPRSAARSGFRLTSSHFHLQHNLRLITFTYSLGAAERENLLYIYIFLTLAQVTSQLKSMFMSVWNYILYQPWFYKEVKMS